jgi:hypothetical protein
MWVKQRRVRREPRAMGYEAVARPVCAHAASCCCSTAAGRRSRAQSGQVRRRCREEVAAGGAAQLHHAGERFPWLGIGCPRGSFLVGHAAPCGTGWPLSIGAGHARRFRGGAKLPGASLPIETSWARLTPACARCERLQRQTPSASHSPIPSAEARRGWRTKKPSATTRTSRRESHEDNRIRRSRRARTRSWHPQFRRTSTRGQLLLRYESGSWHNRRRRQLTPRGL